MKTCYIFKGIVERVQPDRNADFADDADTRGLDCP
jgi:hypothetical protein